MRPVALDLCLAPSARFDNFHALGNEVVLAHLQAQLVLRSVYQTTYIWGGAASGKSHLLRSFCTELEECGAQAAQLMPDQTSSIDFDAHYDAVLIDDLEALSYDKAHEAFAALIYAATHPCLVIAAGRVPLVEMTLRDDVKSRFAAGHVFELKALKDEALLVLLQAAAYERGLQLAPQVAQFMLARFERNVGVLMELLNALDRHALDYQRAITIPLIKEFIANRS